MGRSRRIYCGGYCEVACDFERLVVNVSGDVYETYASTLHRFPATLLGNVKKRRLHYCTSTKQYFFDRNRKCFAAILFYYQSGGTQHLQTTPIGWP